MADRAEIKQAEKVHFEELVVRQLVEGVLELGLLATKVGPEGVLEFSFEVLGRVSICHVFCGGVVGLSGLDYIVSRLIQ